MFVNSFKFLVIIILLCSCQDNDQYEENLIEVPIKLEQGFGPFTATYAALTSEHTMESAGGAPWVPTYQPVNGIPEDWTGVVKSMVWLNAFQFVYQNYQEGKISQEMYDDLQKSWKWTPDELSLSKKPIKSFVYVIRGKDKNGRIGVKIDTNNNLDFSDETAFYPAKVRGKENVNEDSLRFYDKPWMVQYEHVRNGKLIKDNIPMIVKEAVDYEFPNNFWRSIPLYGLATLKWKGREYQLRISNMFDGPLLHDSRVFMQDEVKDGEYITFNKGIDKGEIIEVGSILSKQKFKYIGVDGRTNSLLLEPVSEGSETYSLQRGYTFRPFKAQEFRTGKPLTTSDFKGKYVFIDFWGTWCGPCVQDLPELRKIYNETDKSRVQFVGIVGGDSRDRLQRFLTKHELEWPQILSDSVNKLVETYNIQAYPTTVLVGPDGRVVEKDLRGDALRKKLREISAGSSL